MNTDVSRKLKEKKMQVDNELFTRHHLTSRKVKINPDAIFPPRRYKVFLKTSV